MTVSLTDRELATVLAALREWQGILAGAEPAEENVGAFASDAGRLVPLSPLEIDELCDYLNHQPEEQ